MEFDVLTNLRNIVLTNFKKSQSQIYVQLPENYKIISYPSFENDYKNFTFDSFVTSLFQVNHVNQWISDVYMNLIINDLKNAYYKNKQINIQISKLSQEVLKDQFFNKSFNDFILKNNSIQFAVINKQQNEILFN
jgi:hypothetical protein